jgi:protein-S-isoprenylcysteine O-methyltransferase Ste14
MPMHFGPRAVFAIIWVAWVVSWIAASLWSARTQKRATISVGLTYQILTLIGAALMTPWAARRLGAAPLWNVGYAGAYLLAAATLAGLAFTWWARLHLGRLWSGTITRKENHHIVDSGPYALVRHPIYTGLIAALIASALAEATPTALGGAALLALQPSLAPRLTRRIAAACRCCCRFGGAARVRRHRALSDPR